MATPLAQDLAALTCLAERFGEVGLAEAARAALRPLEEKLFRLVVLGQFKRGKSTLVNALLDVDILPSGAAPVTSVSTVIRWAPDASLTAFYEHGEVEALDLARLPDFVVEAHNPGNALGVHRVEVGYPGSILKNGLVLVDTPGIGSTDRGVTKRAYGFLPRVDAGLIVLSPDPPIGEAEAAYIHELATQTPHLLFVLNKIDRVPEPEWREVLSFNRRVLADLLGRAPEEIEIMPVSARRALEDGDGSVSALRDRIDGFVARHGARVREELAERRLLTAAATLQAGLDVERRALEMEVRELESRMDDLNATVSSLERRAQRAVAAVTAAVTDMVARFGDELLEHARSRSQDLANDLFGTLQDLPPEMSNVAVASHFDLKLEEKMWAILDAWWDRNGPDVLKGVLDEMDQASDDLLRARHEASQWIWEAFGVELPEEPRVDALKETGTFYRRVEGVTPRLMVDLLRAFLPRRLYRAWIRRRVPDLAAVALDMGAGQVRGHLLYRVQETARGFATELRAWALAGTERLMDGVGRAAALRIETGAATEARCRELEEGLDDLERLQHRWRTAS